jgi:hypothetical protein
MSPAKLLGLPQTEDSIIVRAGAGAAFRPLPRVLPQERAAGDEESNPGGSREVLRSLVALRRRGDKK